MIKTQYVGDEDDRDRLPWYLVRKESLTLQFWEVLVSIPLLIYLFLFPIINCFDLIIPLEANVKVWAVYGIFETIILADMVLRFCKVPEKMQEPSLRKTTELYMAKGPFIIDIIYTIICNTLLLKGDLITFSRLKMFTCLLKSCDIRAAAIFLINNFRQATTVQKQMYKNLFNIVLSAFVTLHMIACLWIRLGSLDADLPADQRESWLF